MLYDICVIIIVSIAISIPFWENIKEWYWDKKNGVYRHRVYY